MRSPAKEGIAAIKDKGTMRGFVDLHCHWVQGIDDGARSPEEGRAMLDRLHQVGFDIVIATPHMRPGMFDNDKRALEAAFSLMQEHVGATRPAVGLASEHFFDDIVFARLMAGDGLPYPMWPDAAPKKRGVLVEFPPAAFPAQVAHRFFDLRRAGLAPVLAHPERYQPVWKNDACLDALIDAGAHLLLDVCSLVGKYGRRSQRAAEKLLDDGAYEAACSDAHRPEDVDVVARAIDVLESSVGREEAVRLLDRGPRRILGLS